MVRGLVGGGAFPFAPCMLPFMDTSVVGVMGWLAAGGGWFSREDYPPAAVGTGSKSAPVAGGSLPSPRILFRFPSRPHPLCGASGPYAAESGTGNVRVLHFVRPQRARFRNFEHVGNVRQILHLPFSSRFSIRFDRGLRLFNALCDLSVMGRHSYSPL